MLHKQAKNYLFVKKSAEMFSCEIRSLVDYDRGQFAESSYLRGGGGHSNLGCLDMFLKTVSLLNPVRTGGGVFSTRLEVFCQ